MKLCYILPEYSENTSDHFYHLYELLKEASQRLDIFLIIEKSDIKDIKLGNKFYIQKFRFAPLRFLESFFAILRARILGYKNFYTHYCYIGGINAGIISRLFGGKSYYWHCEMIWEFKQKFFSKLGFNLGLKLSHFLVTGSESLKREYAKHYGLKLENIKIMPNWINLRRFQIRDTSYKMRNTKNILFVHWLSQRKGAHLLAPIISNLKSQISNLKLLIIGDGPYKEKLLQEIKENKLENFVQVLGKIPHKELINYYSQADVFILPSFQEGFPRVLIEAMAMGIPYVASDVGAVREISPKIAQDFLVERGDVKEFAEKIKILLLDRAICDTFKEEELERIKEYSLERAVERFIGLF